MRRTTLRVLRIAWIMLGVMLLAWLTLENQNPRAVLFFSLLVCGQAAFALALRWQLADQPRPYGVIFLGIIAGVAVIPVGLILMALKTGLHSHPAPDFTLEQIAWMVSRIPFWVLVGLLTGCSAFFWLWGRKKNREQAGA